jgi:hypothetical protein
LIGQIEHVGGGIDEVGLAGLGFIEEGADFVIDLEFDFYTQFL